MFRYFTTSDKIILGTLVFVIVGLFSSMVVLMKKDNDEWKVFKDEHHCEVVAYISGDVFNTFTPGGGIVGIGTTSSKTGWKCDDGKTYFR